MAPSSFFISTWISSVLSENLPNDYKRKFKEYKRGNLKQNFKYK